MRVRAVWIGAAGAGTVKRRVDACKHKELPEVLQTVSLVKWHCVLLMRAEQRVIQQTSPTLHK
jgi:hypothetical protein